MSCLTNTYLFPVSIDVGTRFCPELVAALRGYPTITIIINDLTAVLYFALFS